MAATLCMRRLNSAHISRAAFLCVSDFDAAKIGRHKNGHEKLQEFQRCDAAALQLSLFRLEMHKEPYRALKIMLIESVRNALEETCQLYCGD